VAADGIGTLFTFATFFFGGAYMLCTVWLVMIGLALYVMACSRKKCWNGPAASSSPSAWAWPPGCPSKR
jgi:hypothetical protein